MKNSHKWEGNATPYTHDGMNDHSSSGRSEGSASNSRGHVHPKKSWKGATSMNHKSPTAASEAWDAIPGATQTHPMLAVKSSEAGPAYGPGAKMVPTPTTGAKTFSTDPKEDMPKRWHKRYSTDSNLGAGAGKARKAPNK